MGAWEERLALIGRLEAAGWVPVPVGSFAQLWQCPSCFCLCALDSCERHASVPHPQGT